MTDHLTIVLSCCLLIGPTRTSNVDPTIYEVHHSFPITPDMRGSTLDPANLTYSFYKILANYRRGTLVLHPY